MSEDIRARFRARLVLPVVCWSWMSLPVYGVFIAGVSVADHRARPRSLARSPSRPLVERHSRVEDATLGSGRRLPRRCPFRAPRVCSRRSLRRLSQGDGHQPMRPTRTLRACFVVALLAISATPLISSLLDNCETIESSDRGAPARCPGLWASCCDFGPPTTRVGDVSAGKSGVFPGPVGTPMPPHTLSLPTRALVGTQAAPELWEWEPPGLSLVLLPDRLTVLRL